MTEIEINSHLYQVGKLPALQQFHVARRLAPLLPNLLPLIQEALAQLERVERERDMRGEAKDQLIPWSAFDLSKIGDVAQPFMQALAAMKDEDADYVMNTCLSVVLRKHMDHWTKFWNPQAKRCMFSEEEDAVTFLRLTVQVIMENLGNFTSALGSTRRGAA